MSKHAPLSAEEITARLLYRDGLLLILNKPAGIPVHAGPGGGPNLEQAFDALRFGFPNPPTLAHRLDRDTSGCLVLGRHPKALRRLGKLFSAGNVQKTYWAVVTGEPPQDEGRIDLALQKITSRTGGWRMVIDPAGQKAATGYKVLGKNEGLSWLELYPETGRTHQIRVHCAAIGCPVLGDPIYGNTAGNSIPMHLHSRSISLPIYPKRPPVTATAPIPLHMQDALHRCGYLGD